MGSITDHPDIPSLVRQLGNLKASEIHDEAARESLSQAIRDASFALETPGESIQRIAYTVRLSVKCLVVLDTKKVGPIQSLQTTVAKIASDLELFETLAKQDGSVFGTRQLSEITKADELLLGTPIGC